MYTQSITRNRRTAFVLAIDFSGSMNERIRFDRRTTTKAEAVATVANRLLFELTERARRSDGIRDYYDIALVGYAGGGTLPLLGERGFHSIAEGAARGAEPPAPKAGYRLPGGGACEVLLLIDKGEGTWECLVRPGRKMKPGTRLSFGDGELMAEVTGELPGGNRLGRFADGGTFLGVVARLG